MARTVDVNDMLIFAQVADSGGFTSAGKVLGIPKSTVSRRVSELEAALGVRLLQRTTRTLSLTDVGSVYAERCRELRADVDEANLAVTSAGETPRGRLRITSPIEIGRRYLAPVVAEYARRNESVEVEFELSDVRRDIVAEGWDLAIRVGELADSSLIARRLGPTQQFVCAAPSYLARRGEPGEPEALREHDTIVMTSGIGGFTWGFAMGEETTEVSITPRFVANDFQAVCEMALAGLGLARLPTWVAREYLDEGALVRVLTDHRPRELGVYAVYPTRRHLSAKVQHFLDLLEERFSPAPWVLRG